jgi:hypothetical protein
MMSATAAARAWSSTWLFAIAHQLREPQNTSIAASGIYSPNPRLVGQGEAQSYIGLEVCRAIMLPIGLIAPGANSVSGGGG